MPSGLFRMQEQQRDAYVQCSVQCTYLCDHETLGLFFCRKLNKALATGAFIEMTVTSCGGYSAINNELSNKPDTCCTHQNPTHNRNLPQNNAFIRVDSSRNKLMELQTSQPIVTKHIISTNESLKKFKELSNLHRRYSAGPIPS